MVYGNLWIGCNTAVSIIKHNDHECFSIIDLSLKVIIREVRI